ALALTGAGVAILAPAAASAEEPPTTWRAPGLIEILPAGTLIADGKTAHRMHLVAISPVGAPMSGLTGKPQSTAGVAGELVEVEPGLYAFDFTPNAAEQPGEITVSFKGRS